MAAKQSTLERSPIKSDAELEADPLRQASIKAQPKGWARVWMYPSRNHRGSSFRDIDPKSILRLLTDEGTKEVLELDIWKRKLANEDGMQVHSIVMPNGSTLKQGTPFKESATQ